MVKSFKRKLYTRGSSFETTIPLPLLFKLDVPDKRYHVVFNYDVDKDRWYIDFEEIENENKKTKK